MTALLGDTWVRIRSMASYNNDFIGQDQSQMPNSGAICALPVLLERHIHHGSKLLYIRTITAGTPMQTIDTDILGPFPDSSSGNRYILIAMDYSTRWAEAYAIPNQETVIVADKLVSNVFLRFSPPEQLHSDQGRQFESALLQEICRCLGIHKTCTTPYHPQSDGLVERFNCTLLTMLTTTAKDPATGRHSCQSNTKTSIQA